MNGETPDWLSGGKGLAPDLRWSMATDAPLVSLQLARETGDVLAADATGSLYRLNRAGRIAALTRSLRGVRRVAWSDTSEAGAALVGDSTVCRFDGRLEIEWSLELPDTTLAVALDPYGRHVAVSLAMGRTVILDASKKIVTGFETLRPLSFLQFVVTEPALVGAAEYGYLCCRDFGGGERWNAKVWANVGDAWTTANGETTFVAAFSHGIQAFDGEGESHESYLLDGTPNRVGASVLGDRLAAATLERHVYWLDSDGELLWATQVDDDVLCILCDPLGEWIVCGFQSGRILRLDWEGGP